MQASFVIECGLSSGLGRVRRTLTLASMLQQRGVASHIYLSDRAGADIVENQGFHYSLAAPEGVTHDLLFIDSCSRSADEINTLCARATVSCVIDDLGLRPVTCDYVINPNLYAPAVDYHAYRASHIFRGPSHSLIDPRFFERAAPVDQCTGIVVSFGGTDDGTLALPVALELCRRTTEPIFVPVPHYLEPRLALVVAAETCSQIRLLHGPDMAALLGAARCYIGAAGATVIEALAANCMVVATATQTDQYLNIDHLPSVGVITLASYDPVALAELAALELATSLAPVRLNPAAIADIIDAAVHRFDAAA